MLTQEQQLALYTYSWPKKLLVRLKLFFAAVPGAFSRFFRAFGRGFVRFFCGIGRFFANFGRMFVRGGVSTKLSYGLMGLGCATHGQVVKGLIYLAVEALFVLFMVFFGAGYLGQLGTLGTVAFEEGFDKDGFPITIFKDNSFQILLFSILTIIVLAFFIAVYVASVRASFQAEQNAKKGIRNTTFTEGVKRLLDGEYHKTLLTVPAIGILAFTVLPLIVMILLAFTNFDQQHQPPGNLFTWVGFGNFATMLNFTGNLGYTFFNLLGWTLIWAVAATFTSYIFGMLLAMMINKKGIKLKKFWRTMFVISIAVPQFVTLLLMSKVLADEGIVNKLLMGWGWIQNYIPFLSNPTYAKVTVIIVNMWVGIPYTMLITTGILMNIPEDLYESARIDGAPPYITFLRITLPYMLFVTGPYLITQFIGNINNFNVIFLLSGGGPINTSMYQAGSTDLLVTWLYKLTVNRGDYNLASTIGILVFVLCAAFSLITYNQSGAVKKEDQFQ